MRRMFPRQLLLTICLVLLTLLVVSVSFQVAFYQYILQVEQQQLTDTAEAAADMIQLFDMTRPDFLMSFQLNYTARATGNDTMLCNGRGVVIACSCGMQHCEHLGQKLNLAALEKAKTQTIISVLPAQGLYEDRRMSATAAVKDSNGKPQAYIVVSKDYDSSRAIMKNAILINIRTVLILLPVTVIAVWWLTRRQTKPIKQLTAAATQLRHGQMSVRVPIGDNNTKETEELAVAFNNMAQALEQSEQRQKEFVANVSHELRTPMTTISGYMDVMLDGTIPPQQYPKYMQLISEETKRLSRLVQNMLDISKLRENAIPEEHKKRFDLCETVGQTLISFEQKINSKGLQVEAELPIEGAMSYADPDSIGQVVYNLIDNAVKFSTDGGTLEIKIAQTTNNKFLLTITNDGETIPPQELPLLFERFHKADKSRSKDQEGWGLGLYIVHSILRIHGEDIFVTSRDGKTSISFTMQRAEM